MKIARLKITLDDVEPRVMRRVEVPFDIRLDRLHLVIQVAMGWTNSHLFEFRVGDAGWGIPDRDFPDEAQDARKARLSMFLTEYGRKKFDYIYDFGDCWEHTISIEKTLESAPGQEYPCLIEAEGNCPPEDVGGYPGYEELLAVKADPAHERRKEFEDWMDLDAFDPRTPDTAFIRLGLKALAKKWASKPRAKSAKPGT